MTDHLNFSLGSLADPLQHNEMVDLENVSTEDALSMLESMIVIRSSEEAIADMVTRGDVKCPCHFAIGQEAIAVGVAVHLRKTDRGFGCHRSHSHYLASGGSVDKLMAEVLGRRTGASKGMGGSMHLFAEDTPFCGSVPIVAGTVPLAVGAAMAAKLDGSPEVGIAYFGDGACEEGIVHESLNLASQMKLPVLFVVENNFYSSHMDIKLRQPSDRTARFADAHLIETEVVDGNNVIEVANAAGRLIERARKGNGPGFLECVTYRWRGHVGPDENIDVGIRRSLEEIKNWKKRDPIARLKVSLLERGISVEKMNSVEASVLKIVTDACTQAYQQPWPEPSDLLDHVYATSGESK